MEDDEVVGRVVEGGLAREVCVEGGVTPSSMIYSTFNYFGLGKNN